MAPPRSACGACPPGGRHLQTGAAGSTAALALLACAAHAQVLIDPVVVELGARQRAAPLTLTLSAKAAQPLVLQTQVVRWHQDADGQPRYEPSAHLMVVPPIVQLKPGESQLVRIAFRGAREGAAEQAYRLILEDISAAARGQETAGQGISFRMRYDLPVMLGATEAPRQALRWSHCDSDTAGQACVRLANDGNRRVTLRTLELQGDGWQLPVAQPGTVLAQGTREWRVPLPAGASARTVAIAGETSRAEPLGSRLPPR